ncbi:MAG TPA: phage tail sheath subtilisin-like domain-containing protein, partial [Blastocatellia bacterium]
RKEDFAARFIARAESFLSDAVAGFFDNGGVRCYVVRADTSKDKDVALQDAIAALAPLDDLDLVAVPDAMSLKVSDSFDAEAIRRVQRAMLEHSAEQGNRLALLDALPTSAEGVLEQRNRLVIGQSEPINAAIYYPWLLTADGRAVPPCGHVAGIFARTDAKTGVFKAPANEEVFSVLDLDTEIDSSVQDQLNPEGVNCLRAFPGRGIRVWGARTLSRDPDWRYVNVRRLFLTVRRWIDMNMTWAAFEANGPRLWVRIQRELTTYLSRLFRDGALKGATPDQAFYVKCDAETNPPEQREVGQVITEIGLAPLSPAEFIVVRIIHRGGAAESG